MWRTRLRAGESEMRTSRVGMNKCAPELDWDARRVNWRALRVGSIDFSIPVDK